MRKVAVGVAAVAAALSQGARGQVTFSQAGFDFEWTADDVNQQLTMKVTGPQAGWVSVGWGNANNFHSGADSVTGWIFGASTEAVLDGSPTSGFAKPGTDGSQDYINESVEVVGGRVTLEFTRPYATGDANDVDIPDANINVFYASKSVPGTDATTFAEHDSQRFGGFTTNLRDPDAQVVGLGEPVFDPASGLTVTVILPMILLAFFKQVSKFRKNSVRSFEMSSPVANWATEVANRMSVAVRGSELLPSASERRTVYTNIKPKALKSNTGMLAAVRRWSRRRVLNSQVSNRQALVMLAFVAAAVFWVYGDQDNYLPEVAWGFVCCAAAFLTIVPATRNSILTWFLFTPFERTVLYHRWLGRFTFLAGLLHTVYFYVKFANEGTFAQNLKVEKYQDGLFSMIFLTIIFITSFDIVRRNYYSFFKAAHFSFVGFYIFGVRHTEVFFIYAILSLVLYFTDFLMRYALKLSPVDARSVEALPGKVTRVRFPKNKYKTYEAGQYVFLNFPAISLAEWHPFTLSSGPHEDYLEVHIKALGDFTGQLLSLAQNAKSTKTGIPKVRVDGPYGRLSFNHKRYESLLMVGGGVGVTPLISVLKDLFQMNMSDLAREKHPVSPFVKDVFFVWVVPSSLPWTWFFDTLKEAVRLSEMGKARGLPNLYVVGFVTKPDANFDALEEATSKLRNFSVSTGRPNFERVFLGIESHLGEAQKRIGVMTCGPQKMVNSVWDCSVNHSKNGRQFDFHQEIFDF